MSTIKAKIEFLHDARPYISQDEYESITLEFPLGALPNTGDVIKLENIQHPGGAFVVAYRHFSISTTSSATEITLALKTESY